MKLNLKKIWRPVVIYVLLFVFSFICAAYIAEDEVIESYRRFVYLGVGLALFSFAFAIIFCYLLNYVLTQSKITKSLKSGDAVGELEQLLNKTRSPSSKFSVSLALSKYYFESGDNDKAASLFDMLDGGAPYLINKRGYDKLKESLNK